MIMIQHVALTPKESLLIDLYIYSESFFPFVASK